MGLLLSLEGKPADEIENPLHYTMTETIISTIIRGEILYPFSTVDTVLWGPNEISVTCFGGKYLEARFPTCLNSPAQNGRFEFLVL